jgi:hypothetical protein
MKYYDLICEDFISLGLVDERGDCCYSCHEEMAEGSNGPEPSPPAKDKYDYWTAPIAYVCCAIKEPADRDGWAKVLRVMRARLRKERCKS